jgi:ABC-type transport system involved in cytochrome c biogenesis permease subunit
MDFSTLLKIDVGVYWFLAFAYAACFVTYIIRTGGIFKLDWAVFGVHTALIVFRWVEAGHPPFQSLYECLSFFSWSAVLAFLMIKRFGRLPLRSGGAVLFAIASAALFYGVTREARPIPLSPALDTVWFSWHIPPAFASYALFVTAFSLKIEDLARRGAELKYDYYSYLLVLFGFPLLTFCVFSGAGWAEEAWGTYWSWTPKETASLVTWCIYAAYLHAKRKPPLSGWPATVLNILGFVSMIFTFLGFNWIAKLLGLPTFHAYG